MTEIPSANLALITNAKLRYLLDAKHPQNGGKATFFVSHGFQMSELDALERALRAHALGEAAMITRADGVRYLRDGALETPDGRNPRIVSVWQVDLGDVRPRFITAYPRRRR
jgi:hypothetical protein